MQVCAGISLQCNDTDHQPASSLRGCCSALAAIVGTSHGRCRRNCSFLLCILALLAPARAASLACEKAKYPPGTLVVDAADPVETAWLVAASTCKLQKLVGRGSVHIDERFAIDRIDRVPSAWTNITLVKNPLRQGAQFPNTVKTLTISSSEIDVAKLKLPPSLESLSLLNLGLKSIERLTLPPDLATLDLTGNALSALSRIAFPARLRKLVLDRNRLQFIAFVVPTTLEELSIQDNRLDGYRKRTLPTTIKRLSLARNNMTAVFGVRWPRSLAALDLSGNRNLRGFEVRESDVAVFQKLQQPTHSMMGKVECTDKTARVVVANDLTLCVISDDHFYRRYGDPIDEASLVLSASRDDSQSNPDAAHGRKSRSAPVPVTNAPPDASDGSAVGWFATAVFVTLAIAVLVFGWTTRRERDSREVTYRDGFTPSKMERGMQKRSPAAATGYLPNDIRNDPKIIPFRLDIVELTIQSVIGHGAFAIVHAGTYHQRPVAVKQLKPGVWRTHSAVLTAFMDEIRLCAALDHPKIVTFIGVAWTTLRDISVVTELMTGGDLHTVLMSQHCVISPADWVDRWPARSPQVQSKLAIALDVAEAVVYLHSFQRPVLHRDLKAKNVLLDARGHAKLSDFGISRAMPEDEHEMLTREVGTAAWTAPEVLRGERYTELADVYSFGVLLVEMDTCSHPFETLGLIDTECCEELAWDWESSSLGVCVDPKLVLKLRRGELRPSVSASCPEIIRGLAERCLAFKANGRPTSLEVAHELRTLLRALVVGAATKSTS